MRISSFDILGVHLTQSSQGHLVLPCRSFASGFRPPQLTRCHCCLQRCVLGRKLHLLLPVIFHLTRPQAFYACAGIGLYLACIMEWIIGNTFPSVVFGTFGKGVLILSKDHCSRSSFIGGFFISYGIIIQPTFNLAASFAPPDAANAAQAGAASVQYNVGLGFYFMTFGLLCFAYFLASLRT